MASVLLAAGTASPNHPADQERQNAQSGDSAGCGDAAVLRLGRRPFCSRSLLGMNGTGQKQNCQSAGEYHAMSKKRAFHHLWNGKTGMSLIQTHLFRLSLFSSAWDLHPFPDSVFSGKIIPEQFFCRKSLHARFGNDRFPPSSTGRTKTKVKGVLAQLVERLVRNEKVRGSNPLYSTIHLSFPLLFFIRE